MRRNIAVILVATMLVLASCTPITSQPQETIKTPIATPDAVTITSFTTTTITTVTGTPAATTTTTAVTTTTTAATTSTTSTTTTTTVRTPVIAPGTVQGRVLWNEQPVAGATVYVTELYDFNSTRYGSATTDANGQFTISGVPDGNKYLYIFGNKPEFWISGVTPFKMQAGSGTLADDTYLPKGFEPTAPTNGATVFSSHPTLQWDPYPGAIDYSVRVLPQGANQYIFRRGDFDPRITDTKVIVDVSLSPGIYTWRVDAFNAQGHIIGASYYPRSFTVSASSP